MDMKKLLEAVNKFAGEPAQKPGDQVRGTEKAKTGGKEHPFKGRLVGDSVEPQGNMLGELSQEAKDKTVEWQLAEEYARFLEDEFKDTGDKRPARKGSREEKFGKRGHKEQPRYKEIKEGLEDESSVITTEVIKLISDGHTEVSPDVITAKVSAALGRPFMLKDLVSANNSSPELQHYIDSINPSKIKFSTDILTVKNQDPMKEKQAAQDGVAKMAARAGNRPRLGESKLNEGTGIGDLIKFKQPYEHNGQQYLYGHVTGFSLNPEKLGVGMGHGVTAATPFMGAEAKGLVVDLKRTPYHSAEDSYGKVTVPLDSFVKLGSALGGGLVQNEIWKFNKIYGFPKPGADIDYSKILGQEVAEGWNTGSDRVHLPDEPSTYWSGNGELQNEYNELYAKLVPDMGAADTIEGEVLRAASKIVYRHYNDGDEFNAASFSQLEPYIGKVTSYDDLAHKATEFALKANGEYHPNAGWDSLDVMDYGPEDYSDDYDEDDDWEDEWYEEPEEEEDEDEVDEAMFPGSSIGKSLRGTDQALRRDSEGAKLAATATPFIGAGAALGGAAAANTATGAAILFAPVAATGVLAGAGLVAGTALTYKALQWLARKVFGTTEEALEFAKAHLAAAQAGQPQFQFQGKNYPVKIKPDQVQDLKDEITNLEIRSRQKQGTYEGWESGPEERAPRERDPDAEYDARRQEKMDIEAEKAQAQRPQTKVYTLTGRGPNMEPNYAFPGEYDSQEAAIAAREKLMADPGTPNPRMIGISTHTRYLDEGRETPLRDREDYQAKKKALQDIQVDPSTSQDPELAAEVMRRLAGLKQQAKAIGLEESRGHAILLRKLKDIEAQGKPVSDEEYAKHVDSLKQDQKEYLKKNPKSIYKPIDEAGATSTASATTPSSLAVDPTTDQEKAKDITQASTALKVATKSTASAPNIVKAISNASQGKQVGQQDMKYLEPLMKDIATVASEPSLAGQFKSLVQRIEKEQNTQAK